MKAAADRGVEVRDAVCLYTCSHQAQSRHQLDVVQQVSDTKSFQDHCTRHSLRTCTLAITFLLLTGEAAARRGDV